jgi:hypothetical protein
MSRVEPEGLTGLRPRLLEARTAEEIKSLIAAQLFPTAPATRNGYGGETLVPHA